MNGLATETEFKCPLNQSVIADALGLTAIHVNRVLRQLRERELVTMKRGKVHIHDLNKLRKLAAYQGGYLIAQLAPLGAEYDPPDHLIQVTGKH